MSGDGVVEGLFWGPERHEPLESAERFTVVAGGGVEGDRYSDRDLTLFEAEAVEGLKADTGIELGPNEMRRNVMTRGIDLNPLVGHRIRVGEVEAVVTELCHPCSDLQRMTQPGVLQGLVNRGGLNADVVKGGAIAVGDPILDLGSA
jgi:MOSC domain-containing protein YiiM